MSNQIFKTDIAELRLENGILYTTFVVPSITLEDAKAHVSAVSAHYAQLLPLPAVVTSRGTKNIPKTVRDYLAGEEIKHVLTSAAMVLSSALAKITVNLFLQFSKPKFPVKAFTTFDAAEAWSREMKKTNTIA
jgi:F0F1-type ATP synthase assembly protein I